MDFDISDDGLRGPERRLIDMLRHWAAGPDAQEGIWRELCQSLGAPRAKGCLRGFEDMLGLLRRHAWHAPMILPISATGYSEDELAIARFVMAATEQRREVAMAEASFLVSPQALLPLMTAATRTGLPLLCEDCRARVMGRGSVQ
ncbi:hypothetical protein [Tropicibacter oceani]|uniref:Uncharacterized protein n=1 Tax=Tropicibacter oceani TaxID=3058420 RepID=A0ABY8QJJ5_9RHOB|nr:hypothetical protein [Tropicibacter oceani]WGW04618.1 hypothetical protein QF118_03440 [Tropicibacter oceani]